MQDEHEGVFDNEIRMFRGSSWSIPFVMRDRKTQQPINISGGTITLTVNSEFNPVNTDNEQFTAAGTLVTDGTDGAFEVTPSTANTDITPGTYYWDAKVVAGGFTYRPVKGTMTILQGIGQ